MVNSPFRFACFWIECHQLACRCCFHGLYEIGVIGKVGRGHCPADIKTNRLTLLFVRRDWWEIRAADVHSRNINKASGRVIAHRVPVMRTKRGRVGQIKLTSFFIPRCGVLNRPSGLQVVTRRPGEAFNERAGRQQFAIQAVYGEEKAIFGRVVQNLTILAVPLFCRQYDRLRCGIIPAFGWCFLIMPDIFACIRF